MKVSGDRSLILSGYGNNDFFSQGISISSVFKPIYIVLFNNKIVMRDYYMNYIGLGFFAWFCLMYATDLKKAARKDRIRHTFSH